MFCTFPQRSQVGWAPVAHSGHLRNNTALWTSFFSLSHVPCAYTCILRLPPIQTACTQFPVSGLLLQGPKLRQCLGQEGPYHRIHDGCLRHVFILPLSTYLLRTGPCAGDTARTPKIWLLHPTSAQAGWGHSHEMPTPCNVISSHHHHPQPSKAPK